MTYAKRGPVVRVVYLLISCIWHALTGFGRLFSGRSLVLCYHGVTAEQAGCFRSQMARLRRSEGQDAGLNVRPVRTRCGPTVRITFDDAFENLLENALPVLQGLGIPAVVFAVPGNLGRTPQWKISASHPEYQERLMTAEQIKQLSGMNVVIGSHTQTHPALPELSPEQIRWELAESKRNLETITGRPVVDLALPHGAYDDVVLEIAREAGYRRVYTLQPRMAGSKEQGDVIGRFSMSPNVWPVEFYLTCAGAYAWLGPWRKCVKAVRRFRRSATPGPRREQ
jgi:peptidoglycan/xylan/chitin deacetylase (PgdA/CDA1 family)